eukprot:gene6798-7903_t
MYRNIVVLCTILVVLVASGCFSVSQLSSKEEFLAKIDMLLDDPDVLLSGAAGYTESQKEMMDQINREALKRIRMRIVAQIESSTSSSDDFVPPTYNQTVIDAFNAKTLLNPPQNLTYNPYNIPGFNTSSMYDSNVCAVVYPDASDRSTYQLVNFTSAAEAEAAGAFVTHLHPCGYCSTTQDLAAYMAHMDLTSPIRDCALVTFISDKDSLECIQHTAGFTHQCSVIWLYDALNTRKECLDICMYDYIMHVPNNVPANSTTLSPCIQCDEDKSGPIFKVVAGRTRRNSGLKSAINRPANTIYNVTHYYY